jgi:glycosyltransferase involved in cell wall biosynthesis
MKIAIVSYEFPPHNSVGGVAFYSYNLARLLAKKNDVYVFSGISSLATSFDETYEDGFKSIRILTESGTHFKFDVVEIFSFYHSLICFELIESPEVGACALQIKRQFPTLPLCVKLHTPCSFLGKYVVANMPHSLKVYWFLKWIFSGFKNSLSSFHSPRKESDCEYHIISCADRVYSPSRELAFQLSNFWNLKIRIDIIKNFYLFESDFAKYILAEKLKTFNDNFTITFVGKLSFLKGADVLFKILRALISSNNRISVNIIGNDESDIFGKKYLSKYSDVISSYGSRLKIFNRLSNGNVIDTLKNTHLVIIPSFWENQPTVIFESFSSGCLVLANNVGGIPEVIIHNETGFLIPDNNIKLYIKYILSVYNSKSLYKRICSNSINYLSKEFNTEYFYSSQMKFYQSLF